MVIVRGDFGGGPAPKKKTTPKQSYVAIREKSNKKVIKDSHVGIRERGFSPMPTAPSTYITPTYSSTGISSVGVGGGGGGGSTTPSTPAPKPQLDTTVLEKILAGIEAKYGVDRESLLAQEGQAGDLFRFVLANLQAARSEAERSSREEGIRRGILRSGIMAKRQAEIANQFAQQEAQAVAERDQKLAQIALALQALDAQLQNAKTNAAIDWASGTLDTEEALAKALELAGTS